MVEDGADPWSAVALGVIGTALGCAVLADLVVDTGFSVGSSLESLAAQAAVMIVLVVAGLWVLARGVIGMVRLRRAGSSAPSSPESGSEPVPAWRRMPSWVSVAGRLVAILALLAGGALAIPVLGYAASTVLLFAGTGLTFAPGRWRLVVPFGVILTLLLYGARSVAGLDVPAGPWGF